MLTPIIKHHLKNLLPVEAIAPVQNLKNNQARKFVTFSLKRSGQHAVINWLCSQIQDIAHFNHCNFERKRLSNWITPINNRVIQYDGNEKIDSGIQDYHEMVNLLSELKHYNNLLYSFEDIDIQNKILNKYIHNNNPTVIIILRDPYNWLASTLKRKDCSHQQLIVKINILVKYLEQALSLRSYLDCPTITINYNKWVNDINYRKDICLKLDTSFSASADKSILEVPDFGGGSSFDGTAPIKENFNNNVLNRWKEFASDPIYRELLNEPRLTGLSKSYFDIDSPFNSY